MRVEVVIGILEKSQKKKKIAWQGTYSSALIILFFLICSSLVGIDLDMSSDESCPTFGVLNIRCETGVHVFIFKNKNPNKIPKKTLPSNITAFEALILLLQCHYSENVTGFDL